MTAPRIDSTPAPGATNLPRQLTSFVGREAELRQVDRLLGAERLVTLTGAGGCGKTRLAIEAAAAWVGRFPDGVWLVELAALAEAALVPRAVATTLGVRELAGQPIVDTLIAAAESRHLLVVLDNCEHLIAACAGLVDTLLRAAPSIRVLATSREPLRIDGEATYRVPSMAIGVREWAMVDPTAPAEPDRASPPSPSPLTSQQPDAVRLFAERATAASGTFALTAASAATAASICRRLDGIPLAIELAAARVRVLSLEQIDARLDQRFRLLTGGSRTALPRHQTLRALVDWSYDLLSPAEQRLFDRLSVFAGGFSLEAVESVCSDDEIDAADVLDLLSRLIEASVVEAETAGGEARYRLLETLRQYGAERLAQAGDTAMWRTRHLDWYGALAARIAPDLRAAKRGEAMDLLERERANLWAALEWGEESGAIEDALRLAANVHRFWLARGHASEGRGWLERLLDNPAGEGVPPAIRAKAQTSAGDIAQWQGDYVRARDLNDAALAIHRELGDASGIAVSLNNLANAVQYIGDLPRSAELLEQSLAIVRTLGDNWRIAAALHNLGETWRRLGERERAETLYREALDLWRTTGDQSTLAATMNCLGIVLRERGDFTGAASVHGEALGLSRSLGDATNIGISLYGLAEVALDQDDLPRAGAHYHEALEVYRGFNASWRIGWTLFRLGWIAVRRGDQDRALALYRESLGLFLESGTHPQIAMGLDAVAALLGGRGNWSTACRLLGAAAREREQAIAPATDQWRAEHDRITEAAGTALDETTFAAAWAEGRGLSVELAVALALANGPDSNAGDAETPPAGPPPRPILHSASIPGGLTMREADVLRSIAAGLTNAQAAERLVVSPLTINAHLRSIYAKIGVTSRSAATRWAIEHGIG